MRWWPMMWLVACGGDKDDAPIEPFTETGTTDTAPTTTDTGTPPVTVPTGLCVPLPAATGPVVSLTPSDNLAAAVAAAAPGDTLSLAAGTYALSAPLVIDKALTLRSAADDPTTVTIDGGYHGGHVVEIQAAGVTLGHLGIAHATQALVHIQPVGADITDTRLHDLHLIDPAERAVFVDDTADGRFAVDGGEISCSQVELSDDGRLEVVDACNVGGFELLSTRDWTIRDNSFDGLWCDRGLARPGIRATEGVRDLRIWRNVMTDTVQGIVLGEGQQPVARRYADDPCGDAYAQAIDSQVVNNIVSAYRQLLIDSFDGIGTGIRVESACNSTVIHNSVYARTAAPPGRYSIEHRFALTTGVVANNLTTWSVQRSDNSLADAASNVELIDDNVWFFPSDGDFHLAPAAGDDVIDACSADYLADVPDDVDGDARDASPDCGADERL